MRITIETDGEQVTKADFGTAANLQPSPAAMGTPAEPAAPPDVLALAATTGALNAGPAPAGAAHDTSAPHPFISPGPGISEAAQAAAISAGSAQSGKPCG
jgi:hypothetical protein